MGRPGAWGQLKACCLSSNRAEGVLNQLSCERPRKARVAWPRRSESDAAAGSTTKANAMPSRPRLTVRRAPSCASTWLPSSEVKHEPKERAPSSVPLSALEKSNSLPMLTISSPMHWRAA